MLIENGNKYRNEWVGCGLVHELGAYTSVFLLSHYHIITTNSRQILLQETAARSDPPPMKL